MLIEGMDTLGGGAADCLLQDMLQRQPPHDINHVL